MAQGQKLSRRRGHQARMTMTNEQRQQSTQVFGQTLNDLGLPIMSKMAVIFSGCKAIIVVCCRHSCPQLSTQNFG
jgi:hypothetical protein